MSVFDNLKTSLSKAIGHSQVALKQRSPEILMVTGAAGVVAAGVLLVRQTLRVHRITEEHRGELEDTRNFLITPTYSEEENKRDIAKVYVKTGLRLIAHYGPTVTIGIGGLVCLLASNNILRQRNVALVAAYKAVETSFNAYRDRVREEFGTDKELDIYRGFREEEITDKKTGEITKVTHVDPNGFSVYSKFFDEASPYWSKTPEYNLIFLKGKQNYFNDYLQSRGRVFLDEVYHELGIPITQASKVVGWQLSPEGDNYIDFGIYDFQSEMARRFVNGDERSIRLDFNVDGVIINDIPDK